MIAGFNPVAVDLACARLMGFNHRRLPVLCRATAEHPLVLAVWEFSDIEARSNDARFAGRLVDFDGPCSAFEPHFGWKGRIEVSEKDHEAGILT